MKVTTVTKLEPDQDILRLLKNAADESPHASPGNITTIARLLRKGDFVDKVYLFDLFAAFRQICENEEKGIDDVTAVYNEIQEWLTLTAVQLSSGVEKPLIPLNDAQRALIDAAYQKRVNAMKE
jgi:hypothetical protein